MRLKILASITLAGALGLVGCAGSNGGSSSSSAAATTTSGGAAGGTTTTTATGSTSGTHASSSSGGTSGTHASSSSGGTSATTATTASTGSPASSSGGAGTTASNAAGSVGGSTGGTGTTVSTGTTGTSAGTTGTSAGGACGADAGSPGTTDADCGCSHDQCHDGQHCTPNGGGATGIPLYYACACTEEDSQGTPDSCRTTNDIPGGNGMVVCDSNTLDCRAPRDYEQVFNYAQTTDQLCASGFTYVRFVEPLPDGGQTGEDLPDGGSFPDFPDGGFQVLCVETCTAGTSNCSAIWTHCEAGFLRESYSDGGSTPIDACTENDCGPDLLVSDGDGGTTTTDAGTYFGACQGDTLTGFCQPFPSTRGGFIGVCFKTGTAGSDQPCTGWFGQVGPADQMCAPGSICVGTGLNPGGPIPAHLCTQACDLDPANIYSIPDCQNVGGQPTSCHALFSSNPAGADFQPGICY